MVDQDEVLGGSGTFLGQQLFAGDVQEFDREPVGVWQAIVALFRVGEANKGWVDRSRLKNTIPEVEAQVWSDPQLRIHAGMLLRTHTPRHGSLGPVVAVLDAAEQREDTFHVHRFVSRNLLHAQRSMGFRRV